MATVYDQSKNDTIGEQILSFQGTWNPNLKAAKDQYSAANEEALNYMKLLAANPTTYQQVAKNMGYLNPNGTINVGKAMDRDALTALQNRAQENISANANAAIRASRIAQARQGAGQYGVPTANLGSTLNKASRENLMAYNQAYNQAENQAYNRAQQMVSQGLQDTQRAQQMNMSALQNQVQMAKEYLNAQQPGLLQDPKELALLVANLAKQDWPAIIAQVGEILGNGLKQRMKNAETFKNNQTYDVAYPSEQTSIG